MHKQIETTTTLIKKNNNISFNLKGKKKRE